MRRPRPRRSTALGFKAAAITAGVIAGTAAAVSAHFARQVLTPAKLPDARVEVWAIEHSATSPTGQRVWINGPDVDLAGEYSFIWAAGAGHARLGPVVDVIRDSGILRVAREVLSVERGELEVGIRGRVTGWWYTDPSELGFEVETIEIPVDGGQTWAWLVRPAAETAASERWAVHVHGRGALPEETLRGVAPLARAGVTSLVLAYRNDPGAPRGVNGRYGLGLAETRDVDDAVSWALSRGATRVTLVGWSMGATATVLSATVGPFRQLIDGLVLDSPALDWSSLLIQQADLARLPRPLARLAMVLLQRGWVRGAVTGDQGTNLEALTAEALAAGLDVPVLIHVSPDDTFVPWEGARAFADQRPELVELRQTTGEHVKLWNVDPQSWEQATEAFVRALDAPSSVAHD